MSGDLWVLVECCAPWLIIIPVVLVINMAVYVLLRAGGSD